MYQDTYNCICQNTQKIRYIIYYVKPTAQLLFKIRFSKGGPTCRRQVVAIKLYQAPVPLSIFRSNSKFDENSERSSFEYIGPITMIFCTRHDSDTVATCAKYRCDRPRIFYTRVFLIFIEFDRNMLSGTGACCWQHTHQLNPVWSFHIVICWMAIFIKSSALHLNLQSDIPKES